MDHSVVIESKSDIRADSSVTTVIFTSKFVVDRDFPLLWKYYPRCRFINMRNAKVETDELCGLFAYMNDLEEVVLPANLGKVEAINNLFNRNYYLEKIYFPTMPNLVLVHNICSFCHNLRLVTFESIPQGVICVEPWYRCPKIHTNLRTEPIDSDRRDW